MRYVEALIIRHQLLAQWQLGLASIADSPKAKKEHLDCAYRHAKIIGDFAETMAEWNTKEFGDCNATQKVK